MTISVGREPPAELRRARGLHARRLLRARRARRLRAAPRRALRQLDGAKAGRGIRSTQYERATRVRDRDDQADGVSRLLPDRLGLHPLRARAGHPGRPGPRVGRRQSLVAWCTAASPTSIRSTSTSSSSASSTPSACSLPDIDVDFCERRRGEVIDYVTRKYGRENVAQIITFGTMKAKARGPRRRRASLDMPYADVDRIAEADPAGARHDAARRRSPRTRCSASMAATDPKRQARSSTSAGASRACRAHAVGARRRRGHRAGADHRLRAALQGQPRRNHDAVGDEGGRARRPPEDGLPRAAAR